MDALTPSRFGSFDDGSSLHLPLPGLFADIDAGSGVVAMTDEFLSAPGHLRVRILHQWIKDLQGLKGEAFVSMFREFAAGHPRQTIVQQIDEFREVCAGEGLVCPSDLPLLLQRF